jgi:ABC-type nitrate/sulfonate/bicarbonate transport system substrate-binding protein
LGWSGREAAEVVAVAQVADRILLPVVVRPEIKNWSDLQGKKLAVDAVDTAYALVLRRVLQAHDLDMDRGDYELVPVGATQHRVESMTKGDTFAGILNPPWDGKAASAGMVRFADHREVLPDYPGGVFAVTRAWLAGRRGDLVRFLKLWLTALRWTNDRANRGEAVKLIAANQGINEKGVARQLERLPASGDMNLKGLGGVLDLRVRFGLVPPKGKKLSVYYDPAPYQEALKA